MRKKGEAVVPGDEVVKALLTAVAILEDLVQVGHDSHMALSALEGIASELGKMSSGERRRFLEALERVAADEPDRATWIRGLPAALGLDHP
ncbi:MULTISPECIES: hypothetical protein [unclassified Streptomyces]|uniref:hypothetical protein n=1 Tax=unclassified Streptomyces TaxID=2593676 RepID=UPI0003A20B4A|nr:MULTISPECIES: hypothetical protein [unclassified Streptomyces]MYX37251.1 hypothetical protein [Streptomyces sp. SID8377]